MERSSDSSGETTGATTAVCDARGRKFLTGLTVAVAGGAAIAAWTLAPAGAAETGTGSGSGTRSVHKVSTAAELETALGAVKAGDTIELADGTYTGKFKTTANGTSAAPITLTGSSKAILQSKEFIDGGEPPPPDSNGCPTGGFGYGLWFNGASNWNLKGFTVDTAAKGIVIDASPNVAIDGIEVRNTGAEAVHFRKNSPNGVIQNSNIHDAGKKQPQYGEGVYIGSAKSNWKCYAGSNGVDASDNAKVLNNKIGPQVTAEGIDIKEGTKNGLISGNTLDGTGQQGQHYGDSAIDTKGDTYKIEDNKVSNPLTDGFQTHTAQRPYGCANTFSRNTFDLGNAPGYAINVTNNSKSRCGSNPNVVYSSNKSSGGKGLTNIETTPGG
ncbi:right-handed parallel beta-helix repeat-containing protein [Streptomyces sp. KR80]|uniref:right-handed parallel beta-helix repeat-containing protein n=1 Tax=Streptomyces sp. KR80 TaxID=3457426 RepID=UPI003FD5DAF3